MKTILFLHGWGGNQNSFAHIKKHFESHFRCIFINFDCNPDKVRTLYDYVSQVEEVIKLENVEKCYIIAHSFGARIAVLLATLNPNLVEKMVLTGAAGLKPRFRLSVWLKIKIYKFKKRFLKAHQNIKSGSPDYRNLSQSGKITFQNIIHRNLATEIRELEVPTLLIFGKKDKSTPLYMAKLWTKLQKSSTLIMYKQSGHFCFIDNPARFISDTERFFK